MKPPPDDMLPPRIPDTLRELDDAREYLGHVSKGARLSESPRRRLVCLVGTYPDPQTAAAWKRALGALREEMLEMGDAL